MSIKRSALRITIWLAAMLLITATCDHQSDFPRELILTAAYPEEDYGGAVDSTYCEYKGKEKR